MGIDIMSLETDKCLHMKFPSSTYHSTSLSHRNNVQANENVAITERRATELNFICSSYLLFDNSDMQIYT
jgi:hypothetical protein